MENYQPHVHVRIYTSIYNIIKPSCYCVSHLNCRLIESRSKEAITLGINANLLVSSAGSSLDKRWMLKLPPKLIFMLNCEMVLQKRTQPKFYSNRFSLSENRPRDHLSPGTFKNRNELFEDIFRSTDAYTHLQEK